MRNLVLVREVRVTLERAGLAEDVVCCVCLESGGTRVFAVVSRVTALANNVRVGAELELVQLELVDDATGPAQLLVRLTATKLAAPGDVVVGMEYLQDTDSVVVLFRSGDLVHVPLARLESAECVGSIDSGALAMSWSPDGELVVIATGNATLFCMSKAWLPVAEVPIRHAHDTAPTRFAASWEADGSRFTSNTAFSDGTVAVSFWSRQCTLLAHCETLPGGVLVAPPVAFRPTGFLTAVSHRSGVVFFESNGLRHGGFDLRCNEHASALQWSPDASLLATLCDGRMQLWRVSNHAWHLCWEQDVGHDARMLGWSAAHPARLVLLSSAYGLRALDFVRDVFCSTQHGHHAQDECLAAVVDGRTVRLTPLKTHATPPPFAHAQLPSLAFVPCFVASTWPGARSAALAPDGRVAIWTGGGRDALPGDVVTLPSAVARETFQQVAWLDDTSLLLLARDALHVVDSVSGAVSASLTLAPCEHGRRIHCNKQTATALLVAGASVSRVQHTSGALKLAPLLQLPEPCAWVASNATHMFALSARFKLFAVELASASPPPALVLDTDCTSFVLHGAFVVLTTLKSRLRFVPLSVVPLAVAPALDREVDTGALLVACVPRGARTVLQAPRGNLEVLYPRALLQHALSVLLRSHMYARALELMRKHKMDLSALVDERDVDAFVAHVPEFVAQVPDADRLCLFLTQLGEGTTTPAVINRVCEALRNAMRASSAHAEQHFLLPILTSHVQQRPPQVETALRLVAALHGTATATAGAAAAATAAVAPTRAHQTVYTVGEPRVKKDHAERALDYLTFLVKPDDLFDCALGMYDFELVTLVAKKCQKDPNEYVPFLESLRAMEPARMRYTIDCRLQRWESALRHLAGARDSLAECVALIRERRLYRAALAVYASDSGAREAVYNAYGEYLEGKNHLVEAAICFERARAHDAELRCVVALGDWPAALACNDSPATRAQLVAVLEVHRRWEDVARIALWPTSHEAAGVAAAGVAFASAGLWAEARLARVPALSDQLTSAAVAQSSAARGARVRFVQLRDRLVKLRADRAAWEQLHAGATDNDKLDAPSEYSDASQRSRLSSASRSSNASSLATLAAGMARERSAKSGGLQPSGRGKRLTGKPGSMHEEEWLCREMRTLVPTDDALRSAHRLLVALMRAGLDAAASTLQHDLSGLCAEVDACTALLLAPALVFGSHGQRHWEHWRPPGVCYVVADDPTTPTDTDPKWLVSRVFEWKLALFE